MNRRGETSIAVLLGGIAAWLWATKLIAPAIRGPLVDYIKHYESAYLILADITPYRVIMYYYPVFLALIHQPLFWFEEKESAVVWSIANLVLVLIGSLLLADLIHTSKPKKSGVALSDSVRGFVHRFALVVVLLMIGSFEPLQRVLRSGNVDPINFLLASLMLALVAKGMDIRAGVVWGFFCLVKVMPVLLIPVLIVLRRWRMLGALAAMLIAYGVVSLLTGWWRGEAFLFRHILPKAPWVWLEISLSLHKMAATLFSPRVLDEPYGYARLILGMNVVMGLTYCGFLAWVGRRRLANPELLVGAGLVAVLVFSPLLETIHFSWILPVFALQARAWIEGRVSDAAFAVIAMGWMGLMAADTLAALPSSFGLNLHGWEVQLLLYLAVLTASLWIGARAATTRVDEEVAAA